MGNLKNLDVARLRVYEPEPVVASTSVPLLSEAKRSHFGYGKAGRRQEFLPAVEWGFLCRMAALPGKAGWVGLALYRLTVMRSSRTIQVCCRDIAAQLGINRKSVYNAMTLLEAGGIIRTRRGRGSFATVELLVES